MQNKQTIDCKPLMLRLFFQHSFVYKRSAIAQTPGILNTFVNRHSKEQMQTILKYFPRLSLYQQEQYAALLPLYTEWNSKINVVSRRDIENLGIHHVLHSLAISVIIDFAPGTRVLDAGTGGGFPGIPLAIAFPDVGFHLIDSTGKKIKVVQAIAGELGLNNVTSEQARAEEHSGEYDFVVSRAVTSLARMYAWTRKNISRDARNAVPNGLLYLKGGNLETELGGIQAGYKVFPVDAFFAEEYFREKSIVHIYPH
jgi:16S rRNA (guanine527-N7)-methyltransferase